MAAAIKIHNHMIVLSNLWPLKIEIATQLRTESIQLLKRKKLRCVISQVKMEGNLARTRHFFKVMMPGFQDKLNLPPAFCKKLEEEKSRWAVLKSRKGTWKINVCRNSEGLLCFREGWPQFVNQHSLSFGDFVVFEHTREMHFNVLVFDLSACEKEFLVEPEKEPVEATQSVHPSYHHKIKREHCKESVVSYHSRNPYFVLTMIPYYAHKRAYVSVPVEFVRSNNLEQTTSITLRDPRKRVWNVKLLIQRTPRFGLRFATGWHDFYASNDLKKGDVCVFDLNRRSKRSTAILFDVHIFPAPIEDMDRSSKFS